jgi:pyrroline-5-carboxylate reductase
MGSALLRAWIRSSICPPHLIGVSEPDPERVAALAQELGIKPLSDNRAAAQANTLVLAIKPQVFTTVAAEIRSDLQAELVVSIMAGITLASLQKAFPDRAVVRTMPNTPALVGAGMTALSYGQQITPAQIQWVEQLFQAVGSVVTVAEAQMDAVTALSGSGPGYLAVILEAMIDGGVGAGLPRPIATQLAVQTLLGTGALLQQEKLHPAVLKDQVTSPGGTTIAGIAVLEKAGVRSAFIEAIQAAQERSRHLSRE